MTNPRYHDMPTERVAAVRKMLATQPGQDLIRMFKAKAIQDWEAVMDHIREVADSAASDGYNVELTTRSARNNEWVADTLDGIIAENPDLTFLTTDL